MNYPELETSRLRLMPLSLTDIPGIQKHFSHWEIIQHLSDRVPWPYPADGAKQFVTDISLPAIERGEQLVWAIRLKTHPDETVGVIDYRYEGNLYGNRGFWLAKHLHGQGYMTEAITSFQDYILLERGVESFIVHNATDNPASRRLKEKTGAVFLGEVILSHRNGCNTAEKWVITREGWLALRKINS
jgi:ribosomal-protein-alanine N-acetyltransferase